MFWNKRKKIAEQLKVVSDGCKQEVDGKREGRMHVRRDVCKGSTVNLLGNDFGYGYNQHVGRTNRISQKCQLVIYPISEFQQGTGDYVGAP